MSFPFPQSFTGRLRNKTTQSEKTFYTHFKKLPTATADIIEKKSKHVCGKSRFSTVFTEAKIRDVRVVTIPTNVEF
jgi:hypothetical protein